MTSSTQRDRKRTGWLVIAGLAALTAAEFWLSSVVRPALPYLAFTALLKAALIIYYFMRISQLWAREDQHS
ncbi:MAG: cytochrome C oxidase subunit IV family protein [Chloroflexota bacterium]